MAGRYGGGMMGGGKPVKTLLLQLGSSSKPAGGEADASHFVPPGLGMGASIPLVTSVNAPAEEPREDYMPTERPRGKMIIYWGCGDHAAGPPITIDFSTFKPGMAMPNLPIIAVNAPRGPSASRNATYGDWPNQRLTKAVPDRGSLVGAHTIKGNYTPDIPFSLDANHDFMAPLTIVDQSPRAAAARGWGGGPCRARPAITPG
jgi:hypothetical protein